MSESLKNPWVLTGLIFAVSAAVSYVFSFILGLVSIDTSSLAGSVFGIIFVGWYYTKNFKQIMPENLRKQVAIRWAAISIVVGILMLVFLAGFLTLMFSSLGINMSASIVSIMYMVGLVVVIILGFIEYLLTKWILRITGEHFLKISKYK